MNEHLSRELIRHAHFYGQVDAILTMECRNYINQESALRRLREIVKEFEAADSTEVSA